MRILDRYLLTQTLLATAAACGTLTFLLVVMNAFKRVFEILINNDVPFFTIVHLVLLLVPQALTFTIPWGFLVGLLLVLGRMAHDLEILAVRAAGLGLVTFISPLILFSLVLCLLCFYNNAVLAPRCITAFKNILIDMGRNNPTVLIRAQEPIDKFDGYRIHVDKKYGNIIEGISIWELGPDNIPKRNIRAEKGLISADLEAMVLTITLTNARTEERGQDRTDLSKIQTGLRASQFPLSVPLKRMLERPSKPKSSNQTLGQLTESIFSGGIERAGSVVSLLTELQKRVAMSVSCFTFALVGIPLAVYAQRRETSFSFLLSLVVVMLYFLMIVVADAMKEKAGAYPELMVWLPNLLFQSLGFWLIHKVNRHPM